MGSRPARTDVSVTSHCDIENVCAMERGKFSIQPQYVVSQIVDGPTPSLMVPNAEYGGMDVTLAPTRGNR